MKWAPKIGVAVALLAGVVAAVYLVWSIGFDAVFAAIARAGFVGLALLCLYALVVFISLALGHPMDFVFTGFEIATVALATLIVTVLVLDGRSNWLEGAQLLGVYLIIAVGALFAVGFAWLARIAAVPEPTRLLSLSADPGPDTGTRDGHLTPDPVSGRQV